MNPLYQALICCLVKFVFSIRKSMSSLGSFLLPPEPMASGGRAAGRRGTCCSRDLSADWQYKTEKLCRPTSPASYRNPVIAPATVHAHKRQLITRMFVQSTLIEILDWIGKTRVMLIYIYIYNVCIYK